MAGKRHSSKCILQLGRRPAAQLVGTFRGEERIQQTTDFRCTFAIGLPLQIRCDTETENGLLQLDHAGAQVVSFARERVCASGRWSSGRPSPASLSRQQAIPQQSLDRGPVDEEAACTRLPRAKQASADVVAHRLAACLEQLSRFGDRDLVRHRCKATRITLNPIREKQR